MIRRRDEGGGTALAVALVAVLLLVAAGVAPLGVVLVTRHRAVAAADTAALAAADVLLGAATGVPCDRAAEVVADDLDLVSCTIEGATARVEVRGSALGFAIAAVARAGPPGVSTAGGAPRRGVYGVP